MYFDRGGAVQCTPLDIYAHVETLVQIICMLGDPDLSKLGFDPSMYWDDGQRYVDIKGVAPGPRKVASVKYEIERVVFQRPQLIERGTTCWTVKKVEGDERVLMKDTWQEEGRDPLRVHRLVQRPYFVWTQKYAAIIPQQVSRSRRHSSGAVLLPTALPDIIGRVSCPPPNLCHS